MHFEQVSLEKVKEQIARGEISLTSSSDGVPSCEEDSVRDDVGCSEGIHNEKRKKEWMRFCEKAAVEQDPHKLLALVEEINRLLDETQQADIKPDSSDTE